MGVEIPYVMLLIFCICLLSISTSHKQFVKTVFVCILFHCYDGIGQPIYTGMQLRSFHIVCIQTLISIKINMGWVCLCVCVCVCVCTLMRV